MDDRTLRAVAEIVEPLDFRPAFAVVGGAHLYGFAGPDSDVSVRGVHRSALSAALGAGRSTPVLTMTFLDRGIWIDVSSCDPPEAAARLWGGDPDLLGILRSELVLSGAAALAELGEIATGFVTGATLRVCEHEIRTAFAATARDDSQLVGTYLRLFHALLLGIRVAERREVEPRIDRLADDRELSFVRDLVARGAGRSLTGDPGRVGFLLGEANVLRDRFAEAIRRSSLPAEPADTPALDDWARRYSGAPEG